ncbi:methyltransferase [Halorussus ruber]|uniref:methyltransferase n=1 Tax=Halorussus ruber TaxID=1126238 RepID=UPI00109331BC|nr:methyltransferase [Halorussus ruber]
MGNARKAWRTLRDEGPKRLVTSGVPYIYNNHIAPLLPRRRTVYNGIEVNAARPFDSVLPWRNKLRQNYESGLISSIEQYVEKGDDIVVVGGGWGVTAAKAAERVGEEGTVTVYEGSADAITYAEETVELNGVADQVEIEHSIVGPAKNIRGNHGDPDHAAVSDLPPCDVLELDCEGSEIAILDDLTVRPRVIMVETHGMLGAPSETVKEKLDELPYTVVSEEVADADIPDGCVANDIYVITAVRS